MTLNKELELFKRWFGWDPRVLVLGEHAKVIINLDYSWNYKHSTFWYELNPSNMKPYVISVSIYGDLNIDRFVEACIRKFINNAFIQPYDHDTSGICINYHLDPKYHAEWKQYVKEKTDDQNIKED